MKAIGLTRYLPITDPESLIDVQISKPKPNGQDLLVAIRAIAVNPVDVKIRSPKQEVEESPRVLGWDAAGVVEAVGPEVTLFKPGDEVFYAGDVTPTRHKCRIPTRRRTHCRDQAKEPRLCTGCRPAPHRNHGL